VLAGEIAVEGPELGWDIERDCDRLVGEGGDVEDL
jgi:hypothetical protein